ncbi:hypothetical protein TNCT_664061 [Trichonephila clavata]|uniref:Uncharacterized protein n=1 Tax=Trichonephila clavata TaxID=2740835 RepID=A0A8X6JBN0_TRICU|nr:hypothetical protein TNCT_664061 [Trichonephila clavata]
MLERQTSIPPPSWPGPTNSRIVLIEILMHRSEVPPEIALLANSHCRMADETRALAVGHGEQELAFPLIVEAVVLGFFALDFFHESHQHCKKKKFVEVDDILHT